MPVWRHNPAYFFLLKALLHRICKKQKKATKTPRKNPQNARKTRKRPQIQKTGCPACFYTQ